MKSRSQYAFPLCAACAFLMLALVMPAQVYSAPDSFFDVFLESCQGPPYPATNSVKANISVAAATEVPIATVGMKLNSVTPVAGAHITGLNYSGDAGTPGICSFFDVWMDMPMMPTSFFDVFLEMALPGGGAGLPLSGTPTVVWHSDSLFDIYYDLNVPGQGEQFIKMEFRVPAGQTAKIGVNPALSYMAPSSFFDVFLEMAGTGVGGQINQTLPVFRVVMTGSLGWPQPQVVANSLTKFKQNPDTSVRGLDVLAGPYTNTALATMLADDFICTQTGPISDIHLWGSWLNDQVDRRATFWVGIWSDVPKAGNVASHPGALLWWQQFQPGQYRSALAQTVNFEQFYTPDTTPRILGVDHQIWKYDFFPQSPFVQTGSPNAPTNYWLSVVVSNAAGKFFGWKTTPDHYNDMAVYAPVQLGSPFPAMTATWKTFAGPGLGRELSFMITTSQQQQWGCNKTFYRPLASYANVRVRLPGAWPISGYNGGGGTLPLMSAFSWDWDADNNTVLNWSDPSNSGDWVHVGMEGPGAFPPFLNWGWWDPYNYRWLSLVPQFSVGLETRYSPIITNVFIITNTFPGSGSNGWWPIDPVTNPIPIIPHMGSNVKVGSLSVEYFNSPVALAQLTAAGSRSPMRTDVITVSQPAGGVEPGAGLAIEIPTPPAGANYAVFIPEVIPMSDAGQEMPEYKSTDWAMMPLTQLSPPSQPPEPTLKPPVANGSEVTLTWTAVPGAVYRVQSKTAITDSSWSDAEGDIIAGESSASKTISAGSSACFYRVHAMLP